MAAKQECVDKIKNFEADNKLSLESESEELKEAEGRLEDMVKQLELIEGDVSAKYAAIEKERSDLREGIYQLQMVLDDKEEELMNVNTNAAKVLEYLYSPKSVVVGADHYNLNIELNIIIIIIKLTLIFHR